MMYAINKTSNISVFIFLLYEKFIVQMLGIYFKMNA